MTFTSEKLAELDVLMLFNSPSSLEGIKIHKTAEPRVISAAKQLFEAGFTTQIDGGYLTPLGIEAAEHAHSLYALLNSGAKS